MGKMVHTLSVINSAIRTLLVLLLLVLIAGALWYGYATYHAQDLQLRQASEKIGQLEQENQRQRQEIQQLSLRLKLLKIDRRVARIEILKQTAPDEGARAQTTFRFVELDEHGTPIYEPRTFSVEGDKIFVNYKVVKFEDELVETNSPLGSASICLFQKIFGEYQQPADGFTIDQEGERPQVYGIAEEVTDYEKEIWENFWDIANDPAQAAQYGVRAAHEESPSIQARPGKRYELEIRSSGGISIRPLPDEVDL